MFKSRFGLRFFNHVVRFMEQAELFSRSGNAVLGLSGGIDSMVLLDILIKLKKIGRLKSVKIFHIDHGIRKNGRQQADWLKQYVWQSYSEEVVLSHLTWDQRKDRISDFENLARKKRYDYLFKQLKTDDTLYMAHHIDDSFEWWLMQSLRSGHNKAALGIPVINGKIRRPFMCVTKAQIKKYLKFEVLSYVHDDSNEDTKFDRNFIRHNIVNQVRIRFPAYLKHYVNRSNEAALQMGLSCFAKNKSEQHYDGKAITLRKDNIGINVLFWADMVPLPSSWALRKKLRDLVHDISPVKRSVLHLQIEKTIAASLSNKWGPLALSGGIQVYTFAGTIGLLSKIDVKKIHESDDLFYKELVDNVDTVQSKVVSLDEFKSQLMVGNETKIDQEGMSYLKLFPFWVLGRPESRASLEKILPSYRRVHPLWPKTTEYLIRHGYWFRTSGELLQKWLKLSKLKERRLSIVY